MDPWLNRVLKSSTEASPGNTFPSEVAKTLVGSHTIANKKLTIREENGKLFLSMNRGMKSFFELHMELFFRENGVLQTDSPDIRVYYNSDEKGRSSISQIEWYGTALE